MANHHPVTKQRLYSAASGSGLGCTIGQQVEVEDFGRITVKNICCITGWATNTEGFVTRLYFIFQMPTF